MDADKHQSVYKLAFYKFLTEVPRHVKSTQNSKLVLFLQYIKKNVLQLLLRSVAMQNIRFFTGIQSCSLLLVINETEMLIAP